MSHTHRKERCVRSIVLASVLLAGYQTRAANIDPKADVHPTAVLLGNVTVGAYTKIGPKVVIQGDVTIGNHVNILGNAVVSGDKLTVGNYVRIDYGARVVSGRPGDDTYVRDNCWIGINATVRGSRMEEGSAVGNAAVADFNTHLEKGALLASGAMSLHDSTIPANALLEGRPAMVTKAAITDRDRQRIFGLIPSQWIHYENDNIARAIDQDPPVVRKSYPGIDGRQYWSGSPKIDPTAKIHPTAILMGKVEIGAYTRVGPGVIITGGATIGSHCDIRANACIRANTAIGNYVYIGERVHVGNSRTGNLDDPLWIKDYSYIGPGSALHATRVDAGVYYGANVTSDYGSVVGEGSILTSGASMRHDERIRDHMIFQGVMGLMEEPRRVNSKPGISDQQITELIGFQPRKWLQEVMGPALEKPEAYETPRKDWDHVNTGTVKGAVRPGATLVGNVSIGENTVVSPGAYLEGNITIGKRCVVQMDVMVVSKDAIIGDYANLYDVATVVDGRPAKTASTTNAVPDLVRIAAFSWINHLAALQGASTEEFSIANIGVTAAYGTKIEREAMLLNNSATYAGQRLPARSISYGSPVQTRLLNSTMREREWFFYGKNYPNWERQATPEELKAYKLPDE